VDENTFSGHAFVLSYVHPIVSRSAYQNDSQNDDMSGDGQQMRRGKNPKSGNKRQRKPQQRYRDPAL
jgi:hypothetical protein